MLDFIADYEVNDDSLNFGLMNREYDKSLVEYIADTCKSLEFLKNVEFVGYTYEEDESKIDLNHYISFRKKNKRKGKKSKQEEKYMFLQDSRVGEMTLKFRLTCKDGTANVTKKILLPVADKDGYYIIKGKKYFLMYQLVDASTYMVKGILSLKSLMPVKIRRVKKVVTDIDNNEYIAPIYMTLVYRKDVDIFKIFFAKFGVKKTFEYFSIDKLIRFVEEVEDNVNNIYFRINNKIYLEVNRNFFHKHQYVQSMAFMVLNICTNRLEMSNIDSKEYWIEKLGDIVNSKYNKYEKGKSTLLSIDRMLDEITKSILKLHPENTTDIFAILRWLVQNFNELKKKNSQDLNNKRLRQNEYIASILTAEFSDKLNRMVGGKNLTLDQVKELFKFKGDLVITRLHKSGILRFDEKINDLDFFTKFKYTIKGPNSPGRKNENTISVEQRGISTSDLGRIDINVCGSSDPGTSGVLTPFCKTNGLYFNDENEPESFKYEFEKSIYNEMKEKSDETIIYPDYEDSNQYFDQTEKMKKKLKTIKISKGIVRDPRMLYIDVDF